MIKTIASTAFVLTLLQTPALAYYCSEPSAPYCASRYDEFDDQWEFDRCKREMENYQYDVERYLDCLSDEADQTISEYNDAVRSFNRRAR